MNILKENFSLNTGVRTAPHDTDHDALTWGLSDFTLNFAEKKINQVYRITKKFFLGNDLKIGFKKVRVCRKGAFSEDAQGKAKK